MENQSHGSVITDRWFPFVFLQDFCIDLGIKLLEFSF